MSEQQGVRPDGRRIVVGPGRWLLTAAAVFVFLAPAFYFVPTSIRQPWDLKTYWFAGRAAAQGLNPYDINVLADVAGGAVGMPFLYPPITVPLLIPLTALPIETASQVWLGIKLLMYVALVLLWHRYFLPDIHPVLLAFVAVFGFNAASVWDLRSGNVAMLEQLLLWLGFVAYTRERRLAFALCVVAAALFKIFPAAFLALLLIPSQNREPEWKLASGSVALLAALVLIPALAGPAWARGFFYLMPGVRPWGLVNPSNLGIIDTLLGDHATPLTRPPFHALALLLLFDAALIGLSFPALHRLWRRRDPREWVLASAILYALLVPRMMVYSYLLVLVPALTLVALAVGPIGGRAIVAALVVAQALWNTSQVLLNTPPRLGPSDILQPNLSFLILLAFWLIYLVRDSRRRGAPARLENQAGRRRGRASQAASRSSRPRTSPTSAPSRGAG